MAEAVSLLILAVLVFSMLAVESRDIRKSVLMLSAAGLLTALIFVIWKAPDVAMTEAAIGAGFTTFLFFMAISRLKKGEASR